MNSILREKTLLKRSQLGRDACRLYSQKIHTVIEDQLFSKNINFFIYLSFNNEVDTFSLIDSLFKAHKNVYVPWTYVPEKKIVPVRITEENFRKDLVPGFRGILQPDDKLLSDVGNGHQNIDVAICPGSLFDLGGARVGYGGGYYDRLLCGESFKNVIKVGVCFDFQLYEKIDQQEHDVPMDYIITESRIICPLLC